jgi:hypothetical protein
MADLRAAVKTLEEKNFGRAGRLFSQGRSRYLWQAQQFLQQAEAYNGGRLEPLQDWLKEHPQFVTALGVHSLAKDISSNRLEKSEAMLAPTPEPFVAPRAEIEPVLGAIIDKATEVVNAQHRGFRLRHTVSLAKAAVPELDIADAANRVRNAALMHWVEDGQKPEAYRAASQHWGSLRAGELGKARLGATALKPNEIQPLKALEELLRDGQGSEETIQHVKNSLQMLQAQIKSARDALPFLDIKGQFALNNQQKAIARCTAVVDAIDNDRLHTQAALVLSQIEVVATVQTALQGVAKQIEKSSVHTQEKQALNTFVQDIETLKFSYGLPKYLQEIEPQWEQLSAKHARDAVYQDEIKAAQALTEELRTSVDNPFAVALKFRGLAEEVKQKGRDKGLLALGKRKYHDLSEQLLAAAAALEDPRTIGEQLQAYDTKHQALIAKAIQTTESIENTLNNGSDQGIKAAVQAAQETLKTVQERLKP